jgi:predicted nucleotidyltransferase
MLHIRALLERLSDAGVEFVILGGVAGIAHGSVRFTPDLDISYRRTPEALETLVAALAPLHPRLRGAPPDIPFQWGARTVRAGLDFTLETDWGPLDLIGEVAGVGLYEAVVAESETLTFFGRPYPVLKLDALIRAKRAAGRKRDLEHLVELEALQELRSKKKD